MSKLAQVALEPLPRLTAALPGTSGNIRVEVEDFVVEEIPAYTPSGTGDHLYLWMEKRNVPADVLARHVARALGCSKHDIGVAGLKDTRAVTRQWLSVPHAYEPATSAIDTENIRVLHHERHSNKLKTGHLRGNQFDIRIRGVADGALENCRQIVSQLQQYGCPNYYGPQRFGRGGNTVELGIKMLRGESVRDKRLRRLALSAVQSALFNIWLARRLADGLLHTVLDGDVMQVVASGGPFVTENVTAEQPRYDAGETVLSGPMFGSKMRAAQRAAGERENSLLSQFELDQQSFDAHKKLARGTRRAAIIRPEGLEVEPIDDDLRLRFALPAGSYATVVLEEVTKSCTAA